MLKKWKIAAITVCILSVVSLGISIPLILWKMSENFSFSRVPNLEHTNFKNQINELTIDKKNDIKRIINSKKYNDNNQLLFLDDTPKFRFEEVNEQLNALKKLGLKSQKLESFKNSIAQIDFENMNFDTIYLPNLYRFINIFNNLSLPLNNLAIEDALTKNYDSKTGLFKTSAQNDLLSKLVISYNLFQTLCTYDNNLLDRFLSSEKLEELFLSFKFETQEPNNTVENYNSGRILLLIIGLLPKKIKEKIIQKRDISNWISYWDNRVKSKSLEEKLLFILSISTIQKSLSNLKSYMLLEKRIVDKIKTKQWDITFINYAINAFGIGFLEKNNVLEIIKERIILLSDQQQLYFLNSIKNVALGNILLNNLGINIEKEKTWNFLKNYFYELKSQRHNQENTSDWYYFSFVISTFYSDEFTQWEELSAYVLELFKKTVNVSNLYLLIKTLNIISKTKKVPVNYLINNGIISSVKMLLNHVRKNIEKINNYELLFSFELDKIFNFKIFDNFIIATFIKTLKRSDGGFSKNKDNIKTYLNITYLVANFVKNHLKDDKNLIFDLKNGLINYLDHVEVGDKIEDYYYFLSIQKILNNLN